MKQYIVVCRDPDLCVTVVSPRLASGEDMLSIISVVGPALQELGVELEFVETIEDGEDV